MRLSLRSDYALRMLICLGARPGEIVNVAEIADAFGISRHHLIRVAQPLRDAGYVVACFAPDGGCPMTPACVLRSVLADTMAAFLGVLDRYRLEDHLASRQILFGLLGMAASSAEGAQAIVIAA
jgi:Rrf2 family nitric oxide-sensitive transcriptional repressor